MELLLSLPPAVAGEVLWRTDRASRADILHRIDNRNLASIISEMPVDWAAHCLRILPRAGIKRVLSLLSPEEAARLKKQLSYKPDTAGARMDPEVTPFNRNLTVAETIKNIREALSLRKVFHCYVIDERGRLLGIAYGIILGIFAMFRFLGAEPPLGGLTFGVSLGFTVGIAIFCSMFIAGTTGAFIPMILKRLNIDPAIATGPFVTTSIDILGVITYFLVATFFLAEHLV